MTLKQFQIVSKTSKPLFWLDFKVKIVPQITKEISLESNGNIYDKYFKKKKGFIK